jgi:hypothetical protein
VPLAWSSTIYVGIISGREKKRGSLQPPSKVLIDLTFSYFKFQKSGRISLSRNEIFSARSILIFDISFKEIAHIASEIRPR